MEIPLGCELVYASPQRTPRWLASGLSWRALGYGLAGPSAPRMAPWSLQDLFTACPGGPCPSQW